MAQHARVEEERRRPRGRDASARAPQVGGVPEYGRVLYLDVLRSAVSKTSPVQ